MKAFSSNQSVKDFFPHHFELRPHCSASVWYILTMLSILECSLCTCQQCLEIITVGFVKFNTNLHLCQLSEHWGQVFNGYGCWPIFSLPLSMVLCGHIHGAVWGILPVQGLLSGKREPFLLCSCHSIVHQCYIHTYRFKTKKEKSGSAFWRVTSRQVFDSFCSVFNSLGIYWDNSIDWFTWCLHVMLAGKWTKSTLLCFSVLHCRNLLWLSLLKLIHFAQHSSLATINKGIWG